MCSVETGLEQNYCDLSLSSATPSAIHSFFPSFFFFYDDHVGVERVLVRSGFTARWFLVDWIKSQREGQSAEQLRGEKTRSKIRKERKKYFFYVT